jgi:competence protein ComEC
VRRSLLVAGCLAVAALPAAALLPASRALGPGHPGLRVVVLDVGQGDAILLDPRHGSPVLVDGGPPGDGLAAKLASAGVERLGAALVTHDQADHAGGIEDLLGAYPVRQLDYGVPAPRILREARSAGVAAREVSAGREIRSGRLRLDVLWPPRTLEESAAARAADPNTLAVVAVARWRGFSVLLTADAEAEAVPVDPGPVDVLKVAHHGSADAGLAHLLDLAQPRLAVISVGAANPYGHPDPSTVATLAAAQVPVMRTDRDGSVEIDVTRAGWSASASK